MKRRTSRAGTDPVPGPLRRSLPLLLQTLLVVALALPAGLAVAPAFLGPARSRNRRAAAPPWQQVPGTLAARRQRAGQYRTAQRRRARPGARPPSRRSSTQTLKPDGAGTFTGVVQDAATGEVLFDRAGDAARVPASNMKLLTAAAALRTLGPDRRFSTTGRGRRRPRVGGAHRRRRRPPRRRRIGPGRRAGPCRARQPGAGDGPGPAGRRRLRPGEGPAGRFPLHRPRAEPGLEPGGRCRRRDGPAVPAGPELGPLRPRQDHRPPPAGRRHDRRRGVRRPARGGRRRRRADGGARRRAGSGRRTRRTAARQGPGRGPVRHGRPAGGPDAADLGQLPHRGDRPDGRRSPPASPAATTAPSPPCCSSSRTWASPPTRCAPRTSPGWRWPTRSPPGSSPKWSGPSPRARTPGCAPRLAGFPVAGLTGTLGDRYLDAATAAGAGLVRAKTGTLNTVIALSGYVVDADGRLLVFSFIGNGLTPGAANKAALDRSASVLAGCGCR